MMVWFALAFQSFPNQRFDTPITFCLAEACGTADIMHIKAAIKNKIEKFLKLIFFITGPPKINRL